LVWFCGAGTAWSQEPDTLPPPDSVVTIGGLTVRVARPVATAGGASAITAGIDSVPAAPAPTLEEVLRRMPLVQIRENSRGEAQPQLRGMESRRVAVLVDGIPITLGWDNRTDLSIVPLTAARELTVVRGLSSVLYGPNALGGVMLVSVGDGARAVEAPRLQLAGGVDNLGSTSLAAGLARRFSGGAGELVLRAGGGYRKRSAVPLPSGVEQPSPADPDERLNSDFEHGNGYLVARYEANGGEWVSLSSIGFLSERGVPPELDMTSPRLWRYPKSSRWVTAVSGGTGWSATPWGEGDLEASVGLDFGEMEIDTYESLAYDSINGGETGEDRTLSFRLLGDHTLGDNGILRGALTLAETRHKEFIEPDERATYRQRLWSLGLEVEQQLFEAGGSAPRARISIGVSVDGSDTPETGGRPSRDAIWEWGARAGGTLAIGEGNVILHGGLSRRVRFPALRELYSGALGKFVVNENLAPEVLAVAELGLTAGRRRLELQVVGFYQHLSDAIVRASVGDGMLQRQNRDRIRSLGVELLATYQWRRFSVTGDLTIKDVTQEDPTAPEGQGEPEYQPWIAGGLGLSVPLGFDTWSTGRLRHLGPRYCVHPDLDTQVRLSSDTWLDLEVGRSFDLGRSGRRLELVLALDNVTDTAVYDQWGLPQPGRLVRLQFRIY
jgi:iron complex outermembrane receptor protein